MNREAMKDLVKWKESSDRKPLILHGARQVGKTWLMKEFGKTYFENYAYINCDNNTPIRNLFTGNFDIDRILGGLELESQTRIEPDKTLLILDEVQEAPEALSSLKYFQENAPHIPIITAGSLLGIALHQGTSFPVGKVTFLDLYPLSFREFLNALGKEDWCKMIDRKDWILMNTFHLSLVDLLKNYYYIGGMPAPVFAFSKNKDYAEVREIQLDILQAYEKDFSKHTPHALIPRLRQLWDSIPSQLAKENRKFIYKLIRSGARAREYELAMMWLSDCGLIHKINRITKPSIPPKAYEDISAFKLFLVDIGLLGAMNRLESKTLLQGNQVFGDYKGALTEQYVLQQLVSAKCGTIHYWSAGNGSAEVDFVVNVRDQLVPIEVKAEENLQAKSLRVYQELYHPELTVRSSMSSYRKETWLINLPLYAIGWIPSII
ncbi:MAG: ATP-binding protein [Caldisericia bacterium]|nr:ATP-binding protein [Caldisericia bacterium]